MHNFPVPYKNELIYSLVARAGVHAGITSPKQLLDEVFGNRQVIATVDLPSHLDAIVENLRHNPEYSLDRLIDRHTLFPTYAPFVGERVRNKARTMMKGATNGALHLSLGVIASRVNHLKALRYCTACLSDQVKQYGEPYWERQWQYLGVDVCEKHGRLSTLRFDLLRHRHEFISPTPELIDETGCHSKSDWEQMVAQEYNCLLARVADKFPTFDQWTSFYNSLARDNNCLRGSQVNHQAIKERFLGVVPREWLQVKGLYPAEGDTSWLKSIFRKHRKSFSFLEHLTVIKCLMPAANIVDVINLVSDGSLTGRVHLEKRFSVDDVSTELLDSNRHKWSKLVTKFGPKQARANSFGGAVYAWLYRHDRQWLLDINAEFKLARTTQNNRVDWIKRDKEVEEQLRKIIEENRNNPECPRRTKNWLLLQTPKGPSNSKNLNKLPLTVAFLNTASETVSEYQVRRLERAVKYLELAGQGVKRWTILRMAGLSKQRITPPAQEVIDNLELT